MEQEQKHIEKNNLLYSVNSNKSNSGLSFPPQNKFLVCMVIQMPERSPCFFSDKNEEEEQKHTQRWQGLAFPKYHPMTGQIGSVKASNFSKNSRKQQDLNHSNYIYISPVFSRIIHICNQLPFILQEQGKIYKWKTSQFFEN